LKIISHFPFVISHFPFDVTGERTFYSNSVSAFRTVSNLLLFLSMENGKWEMANEKSARSAPNRFERFPVFKPPALPEVRDFHRA
jgi:hypothetical protein